VHAGTIAVKNCLAIGCAVIQFGVGVAIGISTEKNLITRSIPIPIATPIVTDGIVRLHNRQLIIVTVPCKDKAEDLCLPPPPINPREW
jgi:hypothetical protein